MSLYLNSAVCISKRYLQLDGTYKTNNNNYNDSESALKLCGKMLSQQLMKSENSNYSFPEYVEELLNQFCNNLNHIIIFWHHITEIEPLVDIFCFNDNLEFFDLRVILNLFPNIEHIEYMNSSFKNNKSTQFKINAIRNYIVKYKHDITHGIRYITIHHKGLSFDVDFDLINWNVEYGDNKMILRNIDFVDQTIALKNNLNDIYQGQTSIALLNNNSMAFK